MIQGKKVLALIIARGGSKGLPRKNIKLLGDKPLIAWTIEAAKKSRYIDDIIVSTEDQQIADVAQRYGAQIPFMRPKNLAEDGTQGIDVILHAVEWLKNDGYVYDIVLLLQPTSPLRSVEDIDKAIESLFLENRRAVVSVCEADYLWVNTLSEDGCMSNFLRSDSISKNRQEVAQLYRLNGAVYAAFYDYLMYNKSFFGDKTFSYIMAKERSVDIDDEMDFLFTEFLIKKESLSK